MAKFDIDFELEAEGITLNGNDVSIDNSDANKIDVSAANEAAIQYKIDLADCRLKYGSRRNIERARGIAEGDCCEFFLDTARNAVLEELSKLEELHKPCDYVERPGWYSLTTGGVARRSFDEWKKSFLRWCFEVPLEDWCYLVVEYEREEGYRY